MRTKRIAETEPIEVTQFVGEVGTRIRLMRLARRLTQAELAQRAELSRATLYEIEKGSLRTRFSDIARLLWALDDLGLQRALASAAEDPVYQEAARQSLLKTARRPAAARA
jgi:transcriptional regulator with XRE-family HTH domain